SGDICCSWVSVRFPAPEFVKHPKDSFQSNLLGFERIFRMLHKLRSRKPNAYPRTADVATATRN
ncbi:MAG: hypothetical protein ACKPAD_14035, partial [Bacteroidota bacterium]